MKKITLFFCFALNLGFCAAQDTKGFAIKGTINGLAEQAKVALVAAEKNTDTVAMARVNGGSFVLNGKLPEPGIYLLQAEGANTNGFLFMGNEEIVVKGQKDQMQQLEISGSAIHLQYLQYLGAFSGFFERINTLSVLARNAGAGNNSDSLKMASSRLVDSIQNRGYEFIQSHPSSPVAAFVALVITYNARNYTLAQSYYGLMADVIRNSFYGKILKSMIDDGTIGTEGSMAVDFTQADTLGTPVSLSSFKGKYVLVDFWASWCGPCRLENPNVVAAFKKFKNKNFTVLGVSLDRDKQKWLEAIKKDNLTWTHVSDLKFWSNEVAQLYRIQSIPQNLLVDPTGKIVGKNLRGADLESRLCQLLGCN